MTEIHHSLTAADRAVMDGIRTVTASAKGHVQRGPFDAVMEQTLDASQVAYEPGTVGGVAGVWCRTVGASSGPTILYIHGGAYIVGTAHSFRHLAGQVAVRANAAAFVPDYRLAPEHPFPAAVDDARAVYAGLSEQGASAVAIVGDSAGGGLALVLTSIARSEASAHQTLAPCAAVAMSPWTDLALTGESLESRAEADPFLTRDVLAAAAAQYLNGQDPRAPLASPLYGSASTLPPLQLHVGLDEILLDDARRYSARVASDGVDVALHVWEGMPHVFPSNVGRLTAADQALDLIGAFLRERFEACARTSSNAPAT